LDTNEQYKEINMDKEPLPGQLHVIFHGSFCFLDDGKSETIEVRLPTVEDQNGMPMMGAHTYLAGNWLSERTLIPDGTNPFVLTGVETGKATFEKAKNLSLADARFAYKPANLYATIILPRPYSIDSLQRGDINPADFRGGDIAKEMVKGVKQVATVQVFTYRFSNHKELSLAPLSSDAFSGDGHLTGVPDDRFCSLHLFAEPDEPLDEHHPRHALRSALKMYTDPNGNPFELDIEMVPDVEAVPSQELPSGTISAEFDDLPKRLKKLSDLAIRRLKGDDFKDIFGNDKALSAQAFSGDNPLNCLSSWGGGGGH